MLLWHRFFQVSSPCVAYVHNTYPCVGVHRNMASLCGGFQKERRFMSHRGISLLNFLCRVISNFLTKCEMQSKIVCEYLSNKTACLPYQTSLLALIIYISKFHGKKYPGLRYKWLLLFLNIFSNVILL